ncbi:FUSC family protein [Algoriphagus sp. D3-2-R+10]|uniref:FUSC family protein n=1 Tax=Algoriphagus aurantiacus TaxID=3103948 RepID=UPI002B366611|nr:FUSC family protein [Algoriphagus sp. D3-2-R+10]MEB2777954.1 FUSC family protein [Algoriphagus sp. D3-2-R+10]
MNQEKLEALTDQELLAEAKKSKSSKIYDAVIIGVLIGVAIYSTVINGFGLLTFLPLVYLPIAAKNKIRNSELQKHLKGKNLE